MYVCDLVHLDPMTKNMACNIILRNGYSIRRCYGRIKKQKKITIPENQTINDIINDIKTKNKEIYSITNHIETNIKLMKNEIQNENAIINQIKHLLDLIISNNDICNETYDYIQTEQLLDTIINDLDV